MRPPPAAFAPATLVVPAGVLHLLPVWAVLAMVGVGMLLAAVEVMVTQVIRLRASTRINGSRANLRILEIEDLPRGKAGRSHPRRPPGRKRTR